MNEFRELFLKALHEDPDPALCLSGGVDSATVLAGFLSRGIKPHCYTFKLGDYQSRDYKVALSMIEHFKLSCTKITIPHNDLTLIRDIELLFKEVVIQKSYIQCCHPFLYIFNMMELDGYSKVYTGFFGDDLFGTSKEPYMAYSRGGEKEFREYRIKDYNDRNSATDEIIKLGKRRGIKVLSPFMNQELADFLLNKRMVEINKPFQKAIAVKAFPEFWNQGKWYRTNEPMQVCSGIREWHDTLLNSPYNNCNAKNVVKVYRSMAAKL